MANLNLKKQMKTLERVRNGEYRVIPMSDIFSTVDEAIGISEKIGHPISFKFNGIMVTVDGKSDPNKIIAYWLEEMIQKSLQRVEKIRLLDEEKYGPPNSLKNTSRHEIRKFLASISSCEFEEIIYHFLPVGLTIIRERVNRFSGQEVIRIFEEKVVNRFGHSFMTEIRQGKGKKFIRIVIVLNKGSLMQSTKIELTIREQ